jgi:hypothetical protein
VLIGIIDPFPNGSAPDDASIAGRAEAHLDGGVRAGLTVRDVNERCDIVVSFYGNN